MAHEQEANKNPQYPLNSNSYKILNKIGASLSTIVYKAICTEPINNSSSSTNTIDNIVAIKSIDLDQSWDDLDNIQRESKAMLLVSHPNILHSHCSFTVDRRLWVVMPYISLGSLQSIMSSSFPNGLSEPCIATILKETLNALFYLHDQGHAHRDIKAGSILIDSNGAIKLADFGVSASLYESSSLWTVNDVEGTPYWVAPEVIQDPHTSDWYSFKADIWSFGVTALELAYGGPPLSHLPPSNKSLLMKIKKRFRLSSDYDHEKRKNDDKAKKFSKAFKQMVSSCLDLDPSRRPSADNLLKHYFFTNCIKGGVDFLVKNVFGLPSVEERFKECSGDININDEDEDFEGDSVGDPIVKISGWNFNKDRFELDPVFSSESAKEDSIVKEVQFGGETIIQDKGAESGLTSPARVVEEGQGSGISSSIEGVIGAGGGIDRDTLMAERLAWLRSSLNDQRQNVTYLIGQSGIEGSGELSREEQEMVQVIERLRMELENERERTFELERELEFRNSQISGAYNSGGGTD